MTDCKYHIVGKGGGRRAQEGPYLGGRDGVWGSPAPLTPSPQHRVASPRDHVGWETWPRQAAWALLWADGSSGSVPASWPSQPPHLWLPGTLPATLDWWDLCKSWQHFPPFPLLAFSILDAFDPCLGFIGLINLISALPSMLTEIIPDNVLLIPVIAEWEWSYVAAYGTVPYLWWLSLAF